VTQETTNKTRDKASSSLHFQTIRYLSLAFEQVHCLVKLTIVNSIVIMSTTASTSQEPAAPSRSTTDPSSSSTNTPDFDRGFKAGVKSQEGRMQAQKERFRAQVDELKREVKNLRGRVEQMDGQGPSVGTPTAEQGEPRMTPVRQESMESRPGVVRRETIGPRPGVVRRETIAEHEMRIKNVERSFGI
jgi:hypothetical protein